MFQFAKFEKSKERRLATELGYGFPIGDPWITDGISPWPFASESVLPSQCPGIHPMHSFRSCTRLLRIGYTSFGAGENGRESGFQLLGLDHQIATAVEIGPACSSRKRKGALAWLSRSVRATILRAGQFMSCYLRPRSSRAKEDCCYSSSNPYTGQGFSKSSTSKFVSQVMGKYTHDREPDVGISQRKTSHLNLTEKWRKRICASIPFQESRLAPWVLISAYPSVRYAGNLVFGLAPS
ncbi:hypothetical protein C2S51_008536 [Perilla frutescens var. frutescens]|nr:hypothetical protein C2S51_008536 [Perilla frutescens var. frutescens]